MNHDPTRGKHGGTVDLLHSTNPPQTGSICPVCGSRFHLVCRSCGYDRVGEALKAAVEASDRPPHLLNLLLRGDLSLLDNCWQEAYGYYAQAMRMDPTCAEAYLGEFMAIHQLAGLARFEEWAASASPRLFSEDGLLQQALQYATDAFALRLGGIKVRLDRQVVENVRQESQRNAQLIAGLLGNGPRKNPRMTLAAGRSHTVGLREDGTAVTAGSPDRVSCCLSGWKDLIAVSASYDYTVGLRADGTVVVADDFADWGSPFREAGRLLSEWKNITAIAAGDFYTLGLRADGTVEAAGFKNFAERETSQWTEITAIAAGGYYAVGLRADGTVEVAGSDEKHEGAVWDLLDMYIFRDIASIVKRPDGTDAVTKGLDKSLCDASCWKDIAAVAAGGEHYVGLRADGTAVAAGGNNSGQCNVSQWRNIVAIAAGSYHTVGLRADGTVVATGHNDNGRCNVSQWRNIVAIAAGSCHTVGLRADGTVVAVGDNYKGECDVSQWKDIRLPED